MMHTWLKSLSFTALAATLPLVSGIACAQNYTQTNLVSDLSTVGAVTVDPNLKNAWGLTRSATSPWWVNSAGTGTSRLYSGAGTVIAALPQVIVPTPTGTGTSEPTGVMFNGSEDFDLVEGNPATAAIFLFVTKQGTISGWNPGVNPTTAVNKVDESANNAVFTGMTWIVNNGKHFLLAANFHDGTVETFDANFNRQLFDFTFSPLPGFAPYNVQAIGTNVVVTFAKQNAAKTATVDAPGSGFAIIYNVDGVPISELQNGPWFDSPWGAELAPQDFGTFSHDLLIANRGSGTISAFNPVNGEFIGTMEDPSGNTLVIPGLWAIEVGNNATAGSALSLFFAAGINGYADGLFGTLTPVAGELDIEDHE
jgi:uncharacterized protein (TIGR03118 family)